MLNYDIVLDVSIFFRAITVVTKTSSPNRYDVVNPLINHFQCGFLGVYIYIYCYSGYSGLGDDAQWPPIMVVEWDDLGGLPHHITMKYILLCSSICISKYIPLQFIPMMFPDYIPICFILFYCIICYSQKGYIPFRCRSVQTLMDDLDLPHDRANLWPGAHIKKWFVESRTWELRQNYNGVTFQ